MPSITDTAKNSESALSTSMLLEQSMSNLIFTILIGRKSNIFSAW